MPQDRNIAEVASEKIPNVFVGELKDDLNSVNNIATQQDVFDELDMMEEQKGQPKILVQAPEGDFMDMEAAINIQNNNH